MFSHHDLWSVPSGKSHHVSEKVKKKLSSLLAQVPSFIEIPDKQSDLWENILRITSSAEETNTPPLSLTWKSSPALVLSALTRTVNLGLVKVTHLSALPPLGCPWELHQLQGRELKTSPFCFSSGVVFLSVCVRLCVCVCVWGETWYREKIYFLQISNIVMICSSLVDLNLNLWSLIMILKCFQCLRVIQLGGKYIKLSYLTTVSFL